MAALAPPAPVGIVGAGTMGEGIAQLAAGAGHEVRLHDTRPDAGSAAVANIEARLRRSVSRGKRTEGEVDDVLARLVVAEGLDDLAESALVIEAIVEDLDAKRRLFADLEDVVSSDALLTTNTSSISVTAIAGALERPQRFAGLHFFNPAPVMQLVEVIDGMATDPQTVDALVGLMTVWGKAPVRAKSTPGFIGNRVARPFYAEALRMLEEGVADVATIDALVRGSGGFPLGPFQLMDLVGIDVNLAVSTSVWRATSHDPRFAPSVVQREMVAAGRLGRKTGRGFYDYSTDEPPPLPLVEPGPIPQSVELVGEPGPMLGLVERLVSGGIRVDKVFGGDPHLRLGGGVRLALTNGTPAGVLDAGPNAAVVDLAHDYSAASLLGIAVADAAAPDTVNAVAGLLAGGGYRCVQLDDAPGLVVARIVACLVNLAADTVHFGVASARDVDTAMRLGFSYPDGPLAWGDRIGPAWVERLVRNLRSAYQEDRYRVSPMLARRVASGAELAS